MPKDVFTLCTVILADFTSQLGWARSILGWETSIETIGATGSDAVDSVDGIFLSEVSVLEALKLVLKEIHLFLIMEAFLIRDLIWNKLIVPEWCRWSWAGCKYCLSNAK